VSITVLKPGLQTTIQSCPRIGLRHQGVASGGAADRLSLALANRLVANAWDMPALEATLLGPTLRFGVPCAFGIAGAVAAVTLNGTSVAYHETCFATAGDELAIGATETGARIYIAFAGGLDAADVLGSQSTYLLAGLGGHEGRALETGDTLRLDPVVTGAQSTPEAFRPPMSSSWALRASASFEAEQLPGDSVDAMFETNWVVGRRADRMGLQLEGPRLDVSSSGRMPSAAVFPGTVQCPEDGLPYLLSVDAGTVGGYPRIAQVIRADRHLIGQLKPGDHVRLLLRNQEEATVDLRAKLDYWREWLADVEQVI
jgi:biotin-dependent carboxylase-like uncharacterized protein